MDLLLVTESWLKRKEQDEIWLKSQEFSKGCYSTISIPRRGPRRGGGLLCISKNSVKTKLLNIIKSDLYEGAVMLIKSGSKELVLLSVYHPPQSTGCNGPFTEQLLDQVAKLQLLHQNIIIMGDFNIHVNDITDADAVYLIDAMSALGFSQVVRHATHKLGNTLDLLFYSEFSTIKVQRTIVTDMLSDHRFVLALLNVGKPKCSNKERTIRKIDNNLIKTVGREFNQSLILDSKNLETCIEEFNKESINLMDKHFPLKKIKISNKTRVPWFDKSTRDQRKIVRNREKIWLRYNEDHQWKAYKRERNRYLNMIKYNKKQLYSGMIIDAKGNIKKLYQVMYGLTGQNSTQEFPSGYSDEDLAEEFADFFLNKIKTIREQFGSIPMYDPTECSVPRLRKFRPLTKEQVLKLIGSMKTKSCELDILPTRILKEILPNCIDSIVKIINLSLEQGFALNWKTAIVRPLLKKLGADLIFKNF